MELITKYADDFKKLFQLYSDFISHTNISSIKNEAEVYRKHFEDSLMVYSLLEEYQKNTELLKIIDVGTGGGFPTLPLAIVAARENLNLHFTALDSTAKKLKFIEIVKAEFALQNLDTLAARAEELGALKESLGGKREFYDIALCRSVAHLRIGLELCIPLIKVNGHFLAYKGTVAERTSSRLRRTNDRSVLLVHEDHEDNENAEIGVPQQCHKQCEPKTSTVEEQDPKSISELEEAKSAMKIMGAQLVDRKVYFNEEREILVFKKLTKTSKLYPRKYSLIKKSPI